MLFILILPEETHTHRETETESKENERLIYTFRERPVYRYMYVSI